MKYFIGYQFDEGKLFGCLSHKMYDTQEEARQYMERINLPKLRLGHHWEVFEFQVAQTVMSTEDTSHVSEACVNPEHCTRIECIERREENIVEALNFQTQNAQDGSNGIG